MKDGEGVHLERLLHNKRVRNLCPKTRPAEAPDARGDGRPLGVVDRHTLLQFVHGKQRGSPHTKPAKCPHCPPLSPGLVRRLINVHFQRSEVVAQGAQFLRQDRKSRLPACVHLGRRRGALFA